MVKKIIIICCSLVFGLCGCTKIPYYTEYNLVQSATLSEWSSYLYPHHDWYINVKLRSESNTIQTNEKYRSCPYFPFGHYGAPSLFLPSHTLISFKDSVCGYLIIDDLNKNGFTIKKDTIDFTYQIDTISSYGFTLPEIFSVHFEKTGNDSKYLLLFESSWWIIAPTYNRELQLVHRSADKHVYSRTCFRLYHD